MVSRTPPALLVRCAAHLTRRGMNCWQLRTACPVRGSLGREVCQKRLAAMAGDGIAPLLSLLRERPLMGDLSAMPEAVCRRARMVEEAISRVRSGGSWHTTQRAGPNADPSPVLEAIVSGRAPGRGLFSSVEPPPAPCRVFGSARGDARTQSRSDRNAPWSTSSSDGERDRDGSLLLAFGSEPGAEFGADVSLSVLEPARISPRSVQLLGKRDETRQWRGLFGWNGEPRGLYCRRRPRSNALWPRPDL